MENNYLTIRTNIYRTCNICITCDTDITTITTEVSQ